MWFKLLSHLFCSLCLHILTLFISLHKQQKLDISKMSLCEIPGCSIFCLLLFFMPPSVPCFLIHILSLSPVFGLLHLILFFVFRFRYFRRFPLVQKELPCSFRWLSSLYLSATSEIFFFISNRYRLDLKLNGEKQFWVSCRLLFLLIFFSLIVLDNMKA